MTSHTERVVVLVDMDCFYCQVEEKLNSKLAGKPIAVVQYNAWKGGGIIAVNYPARDRGVTRHMRGNEAKEKCSEIELVRVPNVRGKADLSKYREAGKRVAEVLQTFTPLLQRASVDEAYMDITEVVNKRILTTNKIKIDQLPNTHVVGCDINDFIYNVYNEFSQNESNLKLAVGGIIVEEIRAAVYAKTGYQCSAGIAHNKILAKLACGLYKPNKQTILPQDGVEQLYENLPLKKIKSLGGKFGVSLSEDLNITYMGELIKFSERALQKKYDEKMASWLYNIARGIDKEPVQVRLVSKSIGCCKKFPGKTALTKIDDVNHWLTELATEIFERLEQDIEENNRKAKSMTVSFAQPINRKNVHSSRVQSLTAYDAKKIAIDAFEILKKFAQKPDGSFKLTFLGLNVGKFEDCKNINDISNFFKPTNKLDNKQNEHNKSDNTINENKEKNNTSFFRSTFKNMQENINKNIIKKSKNNISSLQMIENSNKSVNNLENKENFRNANNSAHEINLNEIEEDAEHSLDIDLNKTFQDIQNIKNVTREENDGNYSDTTVEGDYSEELNHRQEFPHISNQNKLEIENSDINMKSSGNTGKSFFMKYVNKIHSPTKIDDKTKNTSKSIVISEDETVFNIPETSLFDQPSCSYPITKTSSLIIYNDNSNSSSIIDDVEKVCPECNKKVHQFDYVTHMDHHMAEKLMAEEKHLFQIEFQAKKQSLLNEKMSVKSTNLTKFKSVKRKSTAVDNNCSIASFLIKKSNVNDKEMKQCPECDKKIEMNEYACHLDFHAAKKLHLELNPVKYSGNTESVNIKKKNCQNTNGIINISNFFKTVEN